jgi:hypothetical protein
VQLSIASVLARLVHYALDYSDRRRAELEHRGMSRRMEKWAPTRGGRARGKRGSRAGQDVFVGRRPVEYEVPNDFAWRSGRIDKLHPAVGCSVSRRVSRCTNSAADHGCGHRRRHAIKRLERYFDRIRS